MNDWNWWHGQSGGAITESNFWVPSNIQRISFFMRNSASSKTCPIRWYLQKKNWSGSISGRRITKGKRKSVACAGFRRVVKWLIYWSKAISKTWNKERVSGLYHPHSEFLPQSTSPKKWNPTRFWSLCFINIIFDNLFYRFIHLVVVLKSRLKVNLDTLLKFR